jgi:hypothetical protein
MEEEKAQDIAKAFYMLESKYHTGCKESIYTCIKRNFGTNEHSKHLFKLIEQKSERSNHFKMLIPKIVSNFLKKSVTFLLFALLLCSKLFAYYTDLYKDIHIIVEFSRFLPIRDMKWSSYGFQVFTVLIVSLTLPLILNLFALSDGKKYFQNQLKLINFRICFCFPMVPAVIVYYISKLNIISKQILTLPKKQKNPTTTDMSTSIETLSKNNNLIDKGSRLLTELRSNENATEHFIQSLVLIIIIAVKLTNSGTVSGFQELLAGGNEVFLLGLSAVWSMFSIISGKVQHSLVQKQHSVPFAGKMMYLSIATLSMISRVSAIVLYFAPPMGFFNLLMHWKMGNFEKKFYNITETGTLIEVVWKPIHHYEELTYFQLDVYYILFLLLIPIHFLLVAAIKLQFAMDFKSRENFKQKMFHILHQGKLETSVLKNITTLTIDLKSIFIISI